jgi:hypothetical protein
MACSLTLGSHASEWLVLPGCSRAVLVDGTNYLCWMMSPVWYSMLLGSCYAFCCKFVLGPIHDCRWQLLDWLVMQCKPWPHPRHLAVVWFQWIFRKAFDQGSIMPMWSQMRNNLPTLGMFPLEHSAGSALWQFPW